MAGTPGFRPEIALLVLDATVALSWCFEDEASPAMDAILEEVRRGGALVPGLWFLELSNVLLQAERRRRIAAPDFTARLELISALPILWTRIPPAMPGLIYWTLRAP